jgi:hypothetical protein
MPHIPRLPPGTPPLWTTYVSVTAGAMAANMTRATDNAVVCRRHTER